MTTLAAIIPHGQLEQWLSDYGYLAVFLLVGLESIGVPLPGETMLIAASLYAGSTHKLSIELIVAVAAAGAIVGDNIGYQLGRRGLRRLVERPGRFAERRRSLIRRGEAFFARYGSAAVFFGRWLPGLRVVASWLAGADRMPWRQFLLWNGLGGIAWAATVGTLAYALGRSISGAVGVLGFVVVAAVAVVYLVAHLRHARR